MENEYEHVQAYDSVECAECGHSFCAEQNGQFLCKKCEDNICAIECDPPIKRRTK